MKIIRSNAWGTGIHSPYLYGFVTKVIYGKENPLHVIHYPSKTKHRKDLRTAGMVARMITFFKPGRVIFIGGGDVLWKLFSESGHVNGIIHFPDWDQAHFGFKNEFVIWENFDGTLPDLTDDLENSIWIFTNIENQKLRFLMNYFRNSEKVSVTLEVNHSGIIIFNKNLQKENFIIRRYFFY